MNTKKIKPTKKLIIKNPKLQTIRDNFRTIIQLRVRDEWRRLMDLGSLYLEKERINKKLTSTQYRRDGQLHKMREYLITTFANSICVCARDGRLSDIVTGDRVRYDLITEYDDCYVKSSGTRYRIEEKWFSLKYYEENKEFLEEHFKKMKRRLNQFPGRITTILELHERNLREIKGEGKQVR